MASKGQKYKKFGPEVRAEVLGKYLNGTPSSWLEGEYGVPQKTIRNWAKKHRMGIDVTVDRRKGGSGRKKKPENLTKEDLEEQVEILKKYQAFLKARTGRK